MTFPDLLPVLLSYSLIIYTCSSACDLGWTESSGFCYKTFTSEVGFDLAETTCVENGGHLVSIHGQEEDAFVLDQQTRHVNGASVWIGLKRTPTSFTWTDGTEFSYSNVVQDYTVYQGECLAKFPDWQSNQWTPANCPSAFGFLCKKEAVRIHWGEWGAWAACDCIHHTQSRGRQCANPEGNLSWDCPKSGEEERNCNCPPSDRDSAIAVIVSRDLRVTETPTWVKAGRHPVECSRYCLKSPACTVFQYDQTEGLCQMFDDAILDEETTVPSQGYSVWRFLL